MFVLRNDNCFFIDIDDTIAMWNGIEYTPHLGHIELIKRAKIRNQGVVIWSAGGSSWAEKIINEFGLKDYVDVILCKPKWWVDDLSASEVLPESGHVYYPQDTSKKEIYKPNYENPELSPDDIEKVLKIEKTKCLHTYSLKKQYNIKGDYIECTLCGFIEPEQMLCEHKSIETRYDDYNQTRLFCNICKYELF